jgi:translation initiation factor IF-3
LKYKSPRCPYVINYADFKQLRLSDAQNQFHKQVYIVDAKKMASEAGMDLVCFEEPKGASLAFCKIIDFGKWKYQQGKSKKKNASQKKVTKEIRFSPAISDNDIHHKIKQAKEFLNDDNDVVFFMRLKGRQRFHHKDAEERMSEIAALCHDVGREVSRKSSSNNISVRLVKGKETNKKEEEK